MTVEKKRKKILFLINTLGNGGAEKVLVNLANNLNPDEFAVTVQVLFGGGVNEKYLAAHVEYRVSFRRPFKGNSKLFRFFSPQQLYRFFIKEEYQIIVSYLEGVCARIVAGCSDQQIVKIAWIHIEQKSIAQASAVFRSASEASQCYQSFQKIVCVSENVKADFLSLFPKCQQVSVLHNTVDTKSIMAQAASTRSFFSHEKINLIGVGKIVPTKGFERLAKITKILKAQNYPVRTYILGIGPQQRMLEEYLAENELSEDFIFLGYQENPYQYVAQADLFVCASYAEGFSTAVSEALILGVPVVSTKVSGMDELLGSQNQYGVITENNEEALLAGITQLLDNPELLTHYQQQAKKRGQHFDTKKTVQAVEDLLNSSTKG